MMALQWWDHTRWKRVCKGGKGVGRFVNKFEKKKRPKK
jgi:hypothetical protein